MTRRKPRGHDRPYWVHSAPDDDGQRPCARGDYCKQRAVVIGEDKKRRIEPALGYQAFCPADRNDIAVKLALLPRAHAWLILERHEQAPRDQAGRHGKAVAPPLPIRGDVDALLRKLTLVLCSWEDRVRDVAQLTPADPARAAQYDQPGPVTAAATTIGRRLDAVLALQFAPMLRGDGDGLAEVELDGADAGMEILALHYQSTVMLGLVARKPEVLLAVACYQCQMRTLRRADPPKTDDEPLWYSECKNCRHRMTEPDYRDHVKRLAALHGGPKRAAQ